MDFLKRWFRRKRDDADEMFVYGEESLALMGGARVVTMGPNKPFATKGMANSVSLRDLGIELEDLRKNKREDGGSAFAATGGYQLPKGLLPPDQQPQPSDQIPMLVPRNTGERATPPPMDTLSTRQSRGTQALSAYNNDSTAGPAIKTLVDFVIGPGCSIELEYGFETVPPWFDTKNPEVALVLQKFISQQKSEGKSGPGKASKTRDLSIFREYINSEVQKHIQEGLNLPEWAVHAGLDLLIYGDAFGYPLLAVDDDTYVDNFTPKAEFLNNTIAKIQEINPLSVILTVDEFNNLVSATVQPQSTSGSGGGQAPVPISDLTKLIRMKWNGTGYSVYGTSHLSNALSEIALKNSLLAAAKASADRFAVPIRLAKYGLPMSGAKVSGPMAPPRWRDELADALENLNPATQTLVGPFHWDLDLVGAKDGVINLAEEIEKCNRRIMMACGIPPNFLDSNFTSFATAKIQFTNTILKLRQLQNVVGRAIEEGILQQFAEIRGWRAPDGSLLRLKVRWHRGELESDPAIIALIGILAGNMDQRILSDKSMRETLGFSSETEDQNFAEEDAAKQARAAELGIPWPPQAANTSPQQDPGQNQTQPNTPKAPKKKGVNTNPTKVNN